MSNTTNRIIIWVIGIIVAIFLGGTAYFSITNSQELIQVDEVLSQLVNSIEETPSPEEFDEDPAMMDEEETEVLQTEEPSATEPIETNTEVTAEITKEPVEKSVELIMPDSNSYVISSNSRDIVVTLENTTEEDISISLQLLITNKKVGTDYELLEQVFETKKSTLELKSREKKNHTLTLNTIPSSGTYEAWVSVSSDLESYSEKISLTIISYLSESIQFQVDKNGNKINEIVISGIKRFPALFGIPANISWDSYQMNMWLEHDPQQKTSEPQILFSELSSDNSGYSGLLTVAEPTKETIGPNSLYRFDISPVSVIKPEKYTGSIAIYPGNGRQKELVQVSVFLRDALIFPMLTIFIVSLAVGCLVRVGARSSSQNVAYYRLRIAKLSYNLDNIFLTQPEISYDEVEELRIDLQMAKSLLKLPDFDEAKSIIEKVKKEIEDWAKPAKPTGEDQVANSMSQGPTIIVDDVITAGEEITATLQNCEGQVGWEITGVETEQEIDQATNDNKFKVILKEGDACVPYPRKIRIQTIRNNDQKIIASKSVLVVLPKNITTKQPRDLFFCDQIIPFELDEPTVGVNWWVYRHHNKKKTLLNEDKMKIKFDPKKKPGLYTIFVLNNGELIATKRIRVTKSPFQKEITRFNWILFFASLGWALAATVAGTMYISARIPTFGKPLDYLYAIAWALGISTGAIPIEEIIKGKYKPDSKLSVPDLEGMTLKDAKSKAEEKGLTVKVTGKDQDHDMKIKTQSPKAGDEYPADKTITVTLEAQTSANDAVVAPDLQSDEIKKALSANSLSISKQIPNPGDKEWKQDDKIILTLKGTFEINQISVILNNLKSKDGKWQIKEITAIEENNDQISITLEPSNEPVVDE